MNYTRIMNNRLQKLELMNNTDYKCTGLYEVENNRK